MTATALRFVLADVGSDFEALCAAAGFDLGGARRFCALYSGPSRSERRVARRVAERLWLPVALEPMLTGSSLGLDDEPVRDDSPLGRLAARFPAGAAALEIALRGRGRAIAVVLKTAQVERLIGELCAMLPAHSAGVPASHEALRALDLDLDDGPLERATRAGWPRQEGWPEPPRSAAAVRELEAFLAACGAERIAHPGGALLDHLRRTAQRLRVWQARPALVAAGLAHAAYGTAGFDHALLGLGRRPELARRIGVEAEAIVYAYAACDRAAGHPTLAAPLLRDRFTAQTLPLDRRMVRDLAELACANELDVLVHGAELGAPSRAAIAAVLGALRPSLGHRAALDADLLAAVG